MATRIHGLPGVHVVGPGLPVDILLAKLPSLPRAHLARLTQRLIDRMDDLDGDTDLEPELDQCAAGDDGCGPHLNGRDRVFYGSDQEDGGALFPFYGIDQTKGPRQ